MQNRIVFTYIRTNCIFFDTIKPNNITKCRFFINNKRKMSYFEF